MTFKEQIEKYLENLPSNWREDLVQLLCLIKEEKQEPDCNLVKNCETITSLSDFTVNGTVVSIQYKNEQGVTVTRSFDAEFIINNLLDDIDPLCLTDQSAWESLTFTERIELLITRSCECSGEATVPRTFETEIEETMSCSGTAYLAISSFPIVGTVPSSGVEFQISDSLSDIISNLNDVYEGFAEFVQTETGVETTLLVDGHEGISLQFSLNCE